MHHKTTNLLKLFFILLLICTGIIACRKDIDTPSPTTEKVIGKWTWVSSSGAGNTAITPQSAGYELEREYEANGVYKLFKDGKKEEKFIFEFIEATTINFEAPQYILKYRNSGLNKKEKFRENFYFQGNDTLFVQRDCAGCFVDSYVRN